MLGLDQNGGFLLSALVITVVVLVGYVLYLRSRLLGLRRRRSTAAHLAGHSERNVRAAAPMPTAAQVPSRANGPSAP